MATLIIDVIQWQKCVFVQTNKVESSTGADNSDKIV